jgi:hypothetical protein
MPGSPLKRQRQLGVRAEDGSVIAFPSLTHPRAGLSHAQWRALGPAEKTERLFGMSLDDLYEIMSWPIGELDPFRLSVRMQVMRIIFAIGAKALLDGRLGREAARSRAHPRRTRARLAPRRQSPVDTVRGKPGRAARGARNCGPSGLSVARSWLQAGTNAGNQIKVLGT